MNTMLDIDIAMTIRRPRREVATVMFNPRFDHEWIAGVQHARPLLAGPLFHGARVERTLRRRFGRVQANVFQVLDFLPDLRMTLDNVPPFGLRVQYTLEGIPEGTIARIRGQGVHRLPHLVTPVLRRRLRNAVLRDLERLKALVESGIARRAV